MAVKREKPVITILLGYRSGMTECPRRAENGHLIYLFMGSDNEGKSVGIGTANPQKYNGFYLKILNSIVRRQNSSRRSDSPRLAPLQNWSVDPATSMSLTRSQSSIVRLSMSRIKPWLFKFPICRLTVSTVSPR